jgi:hypothetical protein
MIYSGLEVGTVVEHWIDIEERNDEDKKWCGRNLALQLALPLLQGQNSQNLSRGRKKHNIFLGTSFNNSCKI